MNNVKSLFTMIFLVIFCLCSTSCWDDTTSYIDYKCTQGDCKNGFAIFVYEDGDKYSGEWKDGKQHGKGTYTWSKCLIPRK